MIEVGRRRVIECLPGYVACSHVFEESIYIYSSVLTMASQSIKITRCFCEYVVSLE